MKQVAIILTVDQLTIIDAALLDAKNSKDSNWLKGKIEAIQLDILRQRRAVEHPISVPA